MKKLIILVVILTSCSPDIIRQDIKVAWEITHWNETKERVMAHQHSRFDNGCQCFKDHNHIIRVDVRQAKRIPLHQVEKDGVMYELE